MASDAHGTDPGANQVGVLLFVKNGYLSEVEVYNNAGSHFAGLPEAEALKLSEWSPRDTHGRSYLLNP